MNGLPNLLTDNKALADERDELLADNERLRAERGTFRSLTIALLHRLTLNRFTDCAEMDAARAALKVTP